MNAPMDWEQFEAMTADVLRQDDFPRIRTIGGRKDSGIDALEESFYGDESRLETVVQVTSQRAQTDKFRGTIEKLRMEETPFKSLVIVYRQPVSSETRTKILDEALGLGVSVDVRDQSYLIGQLAKPGSAVFARHFRSVREQLDVLLDTPDPLGVAGDRVRHAMLASLGAYVLAPQARKTRHTLFDATVLAAIVALGETSYADLAEDVRSLLPEEQIDQNRLRSTVARLARQGRCETRGDAVSPSDQSLVELGNAIGLASSAYQRLRDYITETCARGQRVDDATRGYIERNLRRGLVLLFRAYGPLGLREEFGSFDEGTSDDLLRCLSQDLPEDLGRKVAYALGSYVEHAENLTDLRVFARNYAALAIRNLDPVGRAWQQTTLSRTVLALDTDAVLAALIEDIPDHSSFTRALASLTRSGVTVAVSDSVLHEVVGHISRADRTYRRFRGRLHRMSPAMVNSDVWHAVVRGYYHAVCSAPQIVGTWVSLV